MSEDIIDLSDGIEPDEMPCCPLCGNEIRDWDAACVFIAHGSKSLAHGSCLMEKRQEMGEGL